MIGLLPGPRVHEAVQATLATLARRHQVPGAQLAVRAAGETLLAQVGEPEHRSGAPVTAATAFPVGSITKSFTATLAMILVADGDLELDEPVQAVLPEVGELRPGTGAAPALTLRHLLSHTGGLPAGPDPGDVRATSLRRYVADHVRGQRLLFPPGSAFSYSNLGYVLVGRLIEATLSMGWAEAVESILLRPLRIDPVFVGDPGPGRRTMASGHSVNLSVGRVRAVRQDLAAPEAPAGALAVSAADLVELACVQLGERPDLLPAEHAAMMRAPAPGADPVGLASGWGLGLATFEPASVVGHDGNACGTSCYLRADPTGWVVALTTNANTGVGLWRDLLAALGSLGIDVGDALPGPAAAPVGVLAGAVGTYQNGELEFAVTAAGGRLWLAVDGDPAAPLAVFADGTFALDDPAAGGQVPAAGRPMLADGTVLGDPAAGQPLLAGRFGRDPRSGQIDSVLLSGRLAARQSRRVGATRLIA
jgi:CubicO group peptidase (beta-lactamase class C family)